MWGVPAGGRARRGCPLGERASTPQQSFGTGEAPLKRFIEMAAVVERSLQQIDARTDRRRGRPRLATDTLRSMAQPGSGRSRAASGPPPQALSPWREPVRGRHSDPELLRLPGIDQLRRMLAGEDPEAPLSRLTGLRLEEVGDGTATFRMPLTGWLLGGSGTIPPGPLTIPADAATACATMTLLPAWTPFTTSELALRVLRPVPPQGSIRAQARVIDPGPPVALAEATLRDDSGALIAHGSSLCLILPSVRPDRCLPRRRRREAIRKDGAPIRGSATPHRRRSLTTAAWRR